MEAIPRTVDTADWITIVLFASVLFLVLTKSFYYSRFLNYIILPFNNKYIFIYSKKDMLFNWFNVLFTFFQLLNCSLFIYLAWNTLGSSGDGYDPKMFLVIVGAVILFLSGKIFLQLGNGFIFNANRIITEFIFKKLSYFNYSGLVMFLANVTLAYIFRESATVVYVALGFILFINGMGLALLIRNHQNFITANFFYFILYLCALEIAPLVIIGSYL
ncbi:DUF4271 domain-containing protein [Flavobacteriaceae bacterium F89]|uniref:DUF4271 domain-containing protein n=1 Tax=Cerina litoralis TaxID=2874477 RepID=A0AAE3JSM3_9FLAO|nr:DUF4271 domain-containing protein [Cerina litoralis]MCG2460682.1 DUF4271 domain-containing protein [Cerina litoralis]